MWEPCLGHKPMSIEPSQFQRFERDAPAANTPMFDLRARQPMPLQLNRAWVSSGPSSFSGPYSTVTSRSMGRLVAVLFPRATNESNGL